MLKKLTWKEDAVFSLKLQDGLFSLCQMRKSSIIEFFARCAAQDSWMDIDLGQEKILAQYFVAENRLKPLFARQIDDREVTPNKRPPQRLMLSAIIEANERYGARLVRLNDQYSMLAEEVVKPDLDMNADWELIRSHELIGMQGSAEKIKTRLIRYFESGVWWDEQKSFLFRGIRLPQPDADLKPCMKSEQ